MSDPRPRLVVRPMAELSPADRAAIVALCTAAFDRDFAGLFDLVPPSSTHILAYAAGELAGHACWMPRRLQPAGLPPLRAAYVDAVATHPAHQGRGVGSAVLRCLAAGTRDYQLRALSTARPSFYARLGWELWHGPTAVRATPGEHNESTDGLLPTPNDTVMILRTPRTPPLDRDALLIANWRAGQPW
jgi:GNAT superfamily N-acetyltransferase